MSQPSKRMQTKRQAIGDNAATKELAQDIAQDTGSGSDYSNRPPHEWGTDGKRSIRQKAFLNPTHENIMALAEAEKIAEIDARIAMTSDPIATDLLYKERDKLVTKSKADKFCSKLDAAIAAETNLEHAAEESRKVVNNKCR